MLFIALVAGIAAANFIYARLAGRDCLRDGVTRVILASRSLQAWDARCKANRRRSDVVVCLTTTPSRLPLIAPTLKSLFAQARAPREIRLHIPAWSKRENRAYELPAWLTALQSLHIVACEDSGPATKLMPALASLPAAQPILVVDDDMLYPPTLVDDLERAAAAHPGTIICSSGWLVPEDLADRPTTIRSHLTRTPPAPLLATLVRRPTEVDIVQGFSGYLVQPRFFAPEVLSTHAQAPRPAFFVDDVWFSAHSRVPKLVVPARRFCFDRWRAHGFLKSNSLGLLNRGDGNPALRNNTLVIRHFPDRWLVSRRGTARLPGDAATS